MTLARVLPVSTIMTGLVVKRVTTRRVDWRIIPKTVGCLVRFPTERTKFTINNTCSYGGRVMTARRGQKTVMNGSTGVVYRKRATRNASIGVVDRTRSPVYSAIANRRTDDETQAAWSYKRRLLRGTWPRTRKIASFHFGKYSTTFSWTLSDSRHRGTCTHSAPSNVSNVTSKRPCLNGNPRGKTGRNNDFNPTRNIMTELRPKRSVSNAQSGSRRKRVSSRRDQRAGVCAINVFRHEEKRRAFVIVAERFRFRFPITSYSFSTLT